MVSDTSHPIASTRVNVQGAASSYVAPKAEILAGLGRALVNSQFALVLIAFIIVIVQVVRVRRSLRSLGRVRAEILPQHE